MGTKELNSNPGFPIGKLFCFREVRINLSSLSFPFVKWDDNSCHTYLPGMVYDPNEMK